MPTRPVLETRGCWRDALVRKGLFVDHVGLKLIKSDMLARFTAKVKSGEWQFDESFRGLDGAEKMKPIIGTTKAEFEQQLRWDLIPKVHKGWVDLALSRLLVSVRRMHIQSGEREKQNSKRKAASPRRARSPPVRPSHSPRNATALRSQAWASDPPPPINNRQHEPAPKFDQPIIVPQPISSA